MIVCWPINRSRNHQNVLAPPIGAIAAATAAGLICLALGVTVGRAADVPCFNAPPGITGWWRGEGNAQDSFGANHGSFVGNVAYAPGRVGQAFQFAPGQGGITAPASLSMHVGPGNGMTIEAWINPGQTNTQLPIAEYGDFFNIGAHFWINVTFGGLGGPGSLYGTPQVGTTDIIVAAPAVITPGIWQ